MYQPPGSKLSLEITELDLDCLEPGEYLNDKIIDFYLMCVCTDHVCLYICLFVFCCVFVCLLLLLSPSLHAGIFGTNGRALSFTKKFISFPLSSTHD